MILLAQVLIFLNTTLRGKLRIRERELDRLQLRGDERLLDLGCGRGAVLIAAARRLPRAAGVAERVVLRPGGRLLVADISHVKDYARVLDGSVEQVSTRGLGPGHWYAGPWMAASLPMATRPVRASGGAGPAGRA